MAFVFSPAQNRPEPEIKTNQHMLLAEGLALNYSFHHKLKNQSSCLGIGLAAGMGMRLPVVNTSYQMAFDDGVGTETFDAFRFTYA
jgi:hypothetical protein